ncbi:leucyl aminopeptidase [Pseudaquabacterium rugosum]
MNRHLSFCPIMDFRTLVPGAAGPGRVAADALLLLVAGPSLPEGLDPALQAAVAGALKLGDLECKPGRQLMLRGVAGFKAPRVLVVMLGEPGADGRIAAKAQRQAAQAALQTLKALDVAELAVQVAGTVPTPALARTLALCALEATYQYRLTKPSAAAPAKLARLSLLAADKTEAAALQAALDEGAGIGEGIALARELGNRPGNHCTPSDLADEARALGRQGAKAGLKVDVLERKQIEALGMGSFLAVARGSEEPPRFIVLDYKGGARGEAPLVLVGKGITFDSGGISIKPAGEMDEMKFDMCGAASVLGTFRALLALKPRLNVVGLIPACENLPDGRALKPGDVVTSLSGTTIEVLNTDAEGRLILCDALTYAARYKPRAVVDIATLTGACVIALGAVRSGLFSADDGLAAELLAAGEAAQDLAWRMPLDDDYDEGLKSNFADVANVAGRAAGSVTAAKFLQRFARDLRWAHLDIAGTAWKGGAAKGSTGRPVGLLVQWLLGQQAEQAAAPRPAARTARATGKASAAKRGA